MTRYIDVNVDEEYITKRGSVIGAEESHDDVFLRITFGSSWDGLTKSVIWENALGVKVAAGVTVDMMLPDGRYVVPVPSEAKKFAGKVHFSLRGVTIVEGIETTATLTATTYFICAPSVYDGNEDEPVPVDSEEFDRLLQAFELLYPMLLTQDEYDALEEAGQVVDGKWYVIPDED